MSIYDVIIVGSGPAGATAAFHLGSKRVKTLLLDKSYFPRDKACGGGISTRVISRFPYLRERLGDISVNWVNNVYLESPSGLSLKHTSESPLYLMIRRYEFDNFLVNLAKDNVEIAQGEMINKIEVLENHVEIHVAKGQTYKCKILIGADGANSTVARQTGLRKGEIKHEYAIDMMEETLYKTLDIDKKDTMYVFYGLQGIYGYGYIFPKTSHINLGVGCKLDYYLSNFKGHHYDYYLKVLNKYKHDQLVKGESNQKNFMAFPIPLGGTLPKTYSDRVILCGDAGGFVNAFTAEGIYYAMVSGELAAKTAILSIQNNNCLSTALSEYEKLWMSEIGIDLAKSVTIQKHLLTDLSRIDRIIKAAKKDNKLAALLAEYATGQQGYYEFRRAVIKRVLPLYLSHKIKKLFGY